jgi:hypothetical protein
MSTGSHNTQDKQLNQDNQWAGGALDQFNNGVGSYMSNVNAALGAGNLYQSKQYLQNQNLMTSGAMNAANTREGQQLRDTTRRAGGNTAALAGTIASSARQGQRDLTDYNATRDTGNTDKWLTERDNLMRGQLGGAEAEGSVFGTSMGGANNALNDITNRQNEADQMWGDIGGHALGAAGAGLAAGKV